MTTKKQIKSDLQIAQEATIKPIKEIAEHLDILEDRARAVRTL